MALNDEEIARQLLQLAKTANEHAIVLIDLEGRVRWWSPGAAKLFSITASEADGMPFSRLFTAADQDFGIDQLEMAIAHADAISEDDRWHQRADGSQFWATGALDAIQDEEGKVIGYGKVLRDRTNLAEQLTLLRAQVAHASTIASAHAETIAKVSHEIRNTLMALSTGMRRLEQPALADDERRHVTQLMKSQTDVLQRLSEDLLADQHGRPTRMGASVLIVLQDMLQEIADNMKPRLGNRQMMLLAPEVPILVDGDRVRLLQAFGNIIDNAVKYTRDDGRIWIKLTVEPGEAVVHVEDDGDGVPPNMLSKIFELFTQADPGNSAGGIGVGLAIVHEVVIAHGGSVQARSEGSDEGSTFTVRLPMRPR